eukprot:3678978-Prymnesium_polylepis.1
MDDFTSATQQTLGRLIASPPLTTQLLERPPFRFLHEILTEVARATEFGAGTLDTDLAQLQSRGAKFEYVSDAIELVSNALGATVLCRPSHVLAGAEPRATNEFLQLLALVLLPRLPVTRGAQRALSRASPRSTPQCAD